jgi:hypothetical protein
VRLERTPGCVAIGQETEAVRAELWDREEARISFVDLLEEERWSTFQRIEMASSISLGLDDMPTLERIAPTCIPTIILMARRPIKTSLNIL